MAHIPIEELLKRCGSSYKLVILAAKRAKEIADGAHPFVDTRQRKATTIALEEIAQGLVLYKEEPAEEQPGKQGRGAKAKDKEEKRKRGT